MLPRENVTHMGINLNWFKEIEEWELEGHYKNNKVVENIVYCFY
jgi:hypothetical protein